MPAKRPNDDDQSNARNLGRSSPMVGILVVVLLLGYFGLYLTALRGKIVYTNYWEVTDEIDPHYRFGGDVAKHFFLPANWVDRHIRKEYWSTVKNGDGTEWHVPQSQIEIWERKAR